MNWRYSSILDVVFCQLFWNSRVGSSLGWSSHYSQYPQHGGVVDAVVECGAGKGWRCRPTQSKHEIPNIHKLIQKPPQRKSHRYKRHSLQLWKLWIILEYSPPLPPPTPSHPTSPSLPPPQPNPQCPKRRPPVPRPRSESSWMNPRRLPCQLPCQHLRRHKHSRRSTWSARLGSRSISVPTPRGGVGF